VISDLVVRDVIPTCDHKLVKVLLRTPEGLANAKDGEEVLVDREKGRRSLIVREERRRASSDGRGA